MRLRLEGEPEELREKSSQLIRTLAERLAPDSPEAAVIHAVLQKALPRKEASLKYPALRHLQKKTGELYTKQMAAMLKEVLAIIGGSSKKTVQKSVAPTDHTKRIADADAARYERVKGVLKQKGYTEGDFSEESGVFYGYSVNELLEILGQMK